MEQQHWEAGERIYLVLQESGTPEKELVLKKLYRMKDAELKQFYLGKLYRGEIASFPRIAPLERGRQRLVSQAPNALAFIDAAAVDSTVKVLRIDGKRPGEPGYVLGSPRRARAVSVKIRTKFIIVFFALSLGPLALIGVIAYAQRPAARSRRAWAACSSCAPPAASRPWTARRSPSTGPGSPGPASS